MPLPVRSPLVDSLAALRVQPRRAPGKVRHAAPTRLGLEDLDGRILPSTVAGDFALLSQYNVLGLAGSKVAITNPQTVVMGNLGLDANAQENFSDGQINGHLIIDATADISHSNNVKLGGPTQIINAAATDAAAIDASNQIAAMTPTQTLGDIRNSLTIAGNGGVNVINVNSIQLDGSSALTLQGGPNDVFYINVSGKFAMTGNTAIQLSGVSQSHVIFNIIGSGEQVAFTGKSFAQGSFLAVNRDIAVSGATVFGQLIGSEGHQIAITSGAEVCGVPFVPPTPYCPPPPPPCPPPPPPPYCPPPPMCPPSSPGVAGDFALLDQYNVLGLAGSKIDITNPQTVVMGNVGLDANAQENFSDGQINGHLIVDPTANLSHSNNVKLGGPTQTVNTAATDAAAIDASNEIAAMTPTQTVGAINNSTTLVGNGGINVINASQVQLDGNSTLTLTGGANDFFFINVTGKFAMTGNTSIQLNGVQQSHVIFNITGSGEQVAFTGKSVGEGTFLAVNRNIAVSGATVFGQLIGAEGYQIAITSGAQVCGVPFCPPPPPCPPPPCPPPHKGY